MERKSHWEGVYGSKSACEVSWYQPHAGLSVELIQGVAPDRAAAILDVGGGASVLVDDLLGLGYSDLTVLDVAGAALAVARQRLGASASRVRWMEADLLSAPLGPAAYDVWHDRAVFHFLTGEDERGRYVAQARHGLRWGGYIILATFAPDGPARCSGLEVRRYSAEALQQTFGPSFRLLQSRRQVHVTPAGNEQAFTWCVLRHVGGSGDA